MKTSKASDFFNQPTDPEIDKRVEEFLANMPKVYNTYVVLDEGNMEFPVLGIFEANTNEEANSKIREMIGEVFDVKDEQIEFVKDFELMPIPTYHGYNFIVLVDGEDYEFNIVHSWRY